MFKKLLKMLFKTVWYLVLGGVALLVLSRLVTGIYGWFRTYGESDVPARRVAIVFGAGLTRSGGATPILRDRIQTAANLYFARKAEKLLMSGDNSTLEYNEPAAMRDYALSLGIPAEDIVLDYAGRRTYDTCYRAKEIFGVTEAILVTQQFHLPRALYLCNMLGVDGVGVAADNYNYRRMSLLFWNIRELAATVTAIVDVHLTRPLPILGKPEPIFLGNAQ
jgi:vancomycin permeability regulator SanA